MAATPFDHDLSRLIDIATTLAEDDGRRPGEQAMARAWLGALGRLVPHA